MASYTPNLNLYKPDDSDNYEDFREGFNDNMDILDQGGGGSGDVVDVEVNGISVVDAGTKIAEITSYEEVTIAEYESIPVADRESNGIAYFIKDLNNESVQGYPPLIYSDEEREIGVWRDGKPLYQSTYSGLSITSSTAFHTTGITTSDIETLVNAEECGGASDGRLISFNVDAYIATNGTLYSAEYSNGWTVRSITIQYTKTTDTAGSGTWNGQGGLAHHYSTSETVVGTWIDGKPLYEKTITHTTNNVGGQELIDISSLNINRAYDMSATTENSNGSVMLNYFASSSDMFNVYLTNNNTKLSITHFGSWTMEIPVTVTLRYTKTTD